MSGNSSPPPSSDDSAVGSMTSGEKQATQNVQPAVVVNSTIPHQPVARGRPKKNLVNGLDLALAAKQMRSNNVLLISRSTRQVFNCFYDLDIHRFESRTDYLINFISIGTNKHSALILRPASILWPETYHQMCDQLGILDAFLLNTEFRHKPVDWLIKNRLTIPPDCRQCKDKMTLRFEGNTVRWQCQKTQACSNYYMPIQRPSFFNNYERVALDKLMFSVYFWSICTPCEEVYRHMNIDPNVLDSIWRRLQNVCRVALEKSYPRFRLTNIINPSINVSEPIDLISIKLNNQFVVCAKHRNSNLVRLGLYIPNVSLYTLAELTESWFAHGAHVRTSESKFLDLGQRRSDLRVELVTRTEMISKDGRFDRNSAFGYIICQLSSVLKDFDSASLSRERLKLILAEMQWRELYGTSPLDAFNNIVAHMAQYGGAADWYSEPSLPAAGEVTVSDHLDPSTEAVWTERHFYATIDPIDDKGRVILTYTEPPNLELPPLPDVRLTCHECSLRFESFDFSMHMIAHIENDRKEHERKEYLKRMLIECKHCFKCFPRDTIGIHSALFRSTLHTVQFGCRICCLQLEDRAGFLKHMRQVHFEHETPYRCPKCKYASSFQRDVFIHFQEEHRHSMVTLCPLCLRGFTVVKPEAMTESKMKELSKLVYNHIAEHYILSKNYTCSNCSLCFIDKEGVRKHKKMHHNPLEVHDSRCVRLSPFIVANEEERYCVKALPMELFIANKRPNLAYAMKPKDGDNASCDDKLDGLVAVGCNKEAMQPSSSKSQDRNTSDSDSSESPSSDSDSFCTASEAVDDDTIHVRSSSSIKDLLHGGEPALKVTKHRAAPSGSECSSQRIIEMLSKMKRADGVIANRSVLLTPIGQPARCCECLAHVSVDHFVAIIKCPDCDYVTHCPRAATKHRQTAHVKEADSQ